VDDRHKRLAYNVRRLAKERRLVLSHVPDFAAVGPRHFWAVMAGERSPTLRWMGQLAGALGVDVRELFRPEEGGQK